MCNLGQGVYERGEERGLEKGLERGKKEQAKASAIKLYRKGWSLSEIAEFLDCSLEELGVWLKLS